MNQNHSQIRPILQDDDFTTYSNSNDIERTGSLPFDYNMTAPEERVNNRDHRDYKALVYPCVGNSHFNIERVLDEISNNNYQNYNVRAQQSHAYDDNSHIDIERAKVALNTNTYSNNDNYRNYNIQSPAVYRETHAYVNNSHIDIEREKVALDMNTYKEPIINCNYQDHNIQSPVFQQYAVNIERVNVNDCVPTEQIGNGNYQDYNIQSQQSHSYVDSSCTNDCNVTVPIEQIDNGNYLDYNIQSSDRNHNTNTLEQISNVKDRPHIFIFRPINDLHFYNVKCEEVSLEIIIKMLNKSLIYKENMQINEDEIIFFHANQYTKKPYKVTCTIASDNYPNVERKSLKFTLEQRRNLEFHLSQYLENYLII